MTTYHTITYVSISCDRCGRSLIARADTELAGEREAIDYRSAERRGLEIVCATCCLDELRQLAAWQLEDAVEGRR